MTAGIKIKRAKITNRVGFILLKFKHENINMPVSLSNIKD